MCSPEVDSSQKANELERLGDKIRPKAVRPASIIRRETGQNRCRLLDDHQDKFEIG